MTQVHVDIAGSGPPWVLIHGWGWHSAIWKPLIPFLSQFFTLYLVDLPGFGKSPVLSKEYELANIFEKIFCVVPKQATWLGWSLGGMLASWVAIHFPERVNRLITIASSPKFLQDDNWPGAAPDTLTSFSNLIRENQQKTLQDFLELQLRGSTGNLFSDLKKIILPADDKALQGGLKLLQEIDLRNDLKKIACPALHIFGELDTLVPARVIASIKNIAPHSECHLIKRAGHLLFLTKMREFLETILRVQPNCTTKFYHS